jgi:hypothetical protein
MPELKIRRADNLNQTEFEKYEKDLRLFLSVFTPQLLAKWLGKDPANISRKLSSIDPITRNDLRDFYKKLSSVVGKLKNGVDAVQIEIEMENAAAAVDQDPEVYTNLWEEVRLLKERLEKQELTIEKQNLTIHELELTINELKAKIKKS